jgi:hypothetical protein
MLNTVATPRTELRAAIAKSDAAAQAETDAAKAVVRAKQLLDDAEQNVALLADGEHKIAKHRASEIKAWATNGGEKPSGELPWHLESLRTFGIEAAARLVEARSAHELLSKELVAASGRCHDEQENVRRAAGAVMTAKAAHLVEELWRAKQKVWSLSDRLNALGYVRVNPRQTVSMPAGAVDAINITHPPALAISATKPLAVQKERWERYLEALARDPDSPLDSM